MHRIRILLLVMIFSRYTGIATAQSNTILNIDRDSICAIAYSHIMILEKLMSTLIENKADPDLCHTLVTPTLDTAEGIFYSGRTLIQDDISDKASSVIARNLPVTEYFDNFINDIERGDLISVHFNNLRAGIPTKGIAYDFINVVCIRESKFKKGSVALERTITFIIDENRKLQPVYIGSVTNYNAALDTSNTEYIDLKEAWKRHTRKIFGRQIDSMTEEQINEEFRKREKDRLKAAIDAEIYKQNLHLIALEVNRIFLEVDEMIKNEDWKNAELKLNDAKNLDPDNAFINARILNFNTLKPSFEKLLSEGDEFFRERKLDSAKTKYKKAIMFKTENDDIIGATNRISEIDIILTNISTQEAKINQGYVDAARKDLEGLLAANPAVPEYYLLYGDCSRKKGRYEEAVANYNKALTLNSKEAYLRLARLYIESSKFSSKPEDNYFKSIQNYTLYLKSVERAEVRDELSATYFKLYLLNKNVQNLNYAIRESRKAVESEPEKRNYIFRLGQLYYLAEKYDSSNAAYTTAISIKNNKNDTLSYFNRGLTFIKLDDFNKAGEDFKVAQTLTLPLAESKLMTSITDSLLAYSRSCYYKKMYADAEKGYSKVIAISKDPYESYYYRGNSRYVLEKFESAIPDFIEAAKFAGYKIDCDIMIAKCEYGRKNYEKAISKLKPYLEKPLTDAVKQKEVYNYTGKSNYQLAVYPEAVTYLELSLELDREQHEIQYLCGVCYYRLNNYKSANEKFNAAIRTNEQVPEYYFFRACSYYKQDQWRSAAEDFKKFNLINKTPATADNEYIYESKYLGISYLNQNLPKEAGEAFTRYLSLNATDPEIYVLRAQAYRKLNNGISASKDLREAIRHDSAHKFSYEAYLNLGEISLEMNSFHGAQADFENAGKFFSGTGCDLSDWGLARAYLAQKEVQKAAKPLQKYISSCKPRMKEIEKDVYVKPFRNEETIMAILKN